jgi:hypothetical protein
MRLSWKCRTANTDHCCRYSDHTCDRVAFSMKIAHSRHVLHRVIKRPAAAGAGVGLVLGMCAHLTRPRPASPLFHGAGAFACPLASTGNVLMCSALAWGVGCYYAPTSRGPGPSSPLLHGAGALLAGCAL